MIDVVLLAGRLHLLALLYLFLFAAVRAGIGLVAGQRVRGRGAWTLSIATAGRPISAPCSSAIQRAIARPLSWQLDS